VVPIFMTILSKPYGIDARKQMEENKGKKIP
jgi:hypothetical protein